MPDIGLYEGMRTLRAVRRLTPEAIPEAVLHRVLEAATWAPTGGNAQPWRAVVVSERSRKEVLGRLYAERWIRYAEGHRHLLAAADVVTKTRAERTLRAGDYLATHFADAPIHVVFCFNPEHMAITDAAQPRVSVVGGASIYPAVQNLLLGCRAEGLGCVLTTLLCECETEVRALLEIPEPWATAAVVPIGYPKLRGHGPISRRPVEKMAFRDVWGRAFVPVLAALALLLSAPARGEEVPAPVSMTDASARVEEVRGTLGRIEAKAAPVASVTAIDDQMPEITASITRRQAGDRDYLAGDVDLGQLTAIGLRWGDDAALLAEWDQRLGRRASDLGALVTEVASLNALWERTRDGLRAAAAPAELLERIEATLSALARTGEDTAARRASVLTLRNRVAQQRAVVTEIEALIEERSRQLLGSLLVPDQLPMWRAPQRPGAPIGDRMRAAFASEREDLREFVTSRRGRAPDAFGALIGLMAVALLLARRARTWQQRAGDTEEATLVVDRPLSAVFVVWVLILPWIHVPMVVRRLTIFVLIIPVVRLLRPLLGAKGTVLAAFVAALLVLDRVEEVLVAVPEIARPLFLMVMAIGVAAARWVRRQPWGDLVLRLSRVAEIIFAVAMAASLLGYRQLAALLGDGTVTAALAALAFWVTTRVLDGVVVVALRSRPLNALHVVQRNQNHTIHRLRQIVAGALSALWVVFVLEIFHLRAAATDLLTTVFGTTLSLGEVAFTLGDVAVLGFSLWASFLLARAVRAILEDEVLSRLQLERGIPYAISTFTSYAVLVLGILVALAATGVDLSRLTIVVGALGVGVGLGLQEIVKDLVAGAVLLFERPIQLGDVVQMGDLTGNVQRIGLRSSTVHTFDGAEVIVPNSSLTSSRIVNWTLSDRARRVDLPVGVAYGTDPARLIAVLEELARRHPDVLEEPAPKALFMQFGESSLDFQLRAWTNRVDQFMAVRSELATAVVGALAEAGISVPFPQRDLHIR